MNDEYLQNFADKVVNNISRKYDEKISDLKSDIQELKTINKILVISNDNLEQQSRLENIKVFGVQENVSESLRDVVLKLFHEELKMKTVNDADIVKYHRVPSRNVINNGSPSPPAVSVRLISLSVRESIMKNRKPLKSTGISIQEDLTKYRLSLMISAYQKFDKKNVWSRNGNLFFKYNDVIRKIYNADDIASTPME
ncbi:unnamed protein product [Phaedon cochleariae]|uniref:Uncharacterized protein n=1 Tax=Phaedon cochleariae TaxID=80249 RepID=A0A9N9X2B7_PHACE|nr:unnamed protein product [Phaedon cochleariae]